MYWMGWLWSYIQPLAHNTYYILHYEVIWLSLSRSSYIPWYLFIFIALITKLLSLITSMVIGNIGKHTVGGLQSFRISCNKNYNWILLFHLSAQGHCFHYQHYNFISIICKNPAIRCKTTTILLLSFIFTSCQVFPTLLKPEISGYQVT